jgi:uncharacterized membrane protein
VIIDLSSDSTKFRSISVKSHYQDDYVSDDHDQTSNQSNVSSIIEFSHQLDQAIINSAVLTALVKRERDRSRKFSASIAYISFMLNISTIDFSFIAFRANEIA